MSTLADFIARWRLPPEAAADLYATLGSRDCAPPPVDPSRLASEARVQSLVRIEAAQAGVMLTRNNVGAYQDPDTGQMIRYGLWNESKAQNQVHKSADLIGFRKRVIVPLDVGTVIAQFVSREVKAEGWKFSGRGREAAQAAHRDFINANGGDAAFVSGPGSFNYTR